MRHIKNAILGITALGILLVGTRAFAGSSSAALQVTATVPVKCTLQANPLNFGAIDPSVMTIAHGSLNVQCTASTSVAIDADQGLNPQPGSTTAVPLRAMTDPNHPGVFLSYAIVTPSNTDQFWGAGSGNNYVYTATGGADVVTVPAGVMGGQTIPPGSYSDTVTFTANF